MHDISAYAISIDHTFRMAKKAKLAGKAETRQSSHAGMFSVINEDSEIIAWVGSSMQYTDPLD